MKVQLYSADKKLQSTVFVNRFKEQEDYVNYTVITPGSERGYVTVALKDLDWFRERGEPIAEVLESRVYDDIIAEITHFFPHQVPFASGIPRHLRRKGIGTSVLRTVIRDLNSWEDIRHFYVHNPANEFYQLLLNQRFMELRIPEDRNNDHLYRKLKIK